MVNKKTFKIAGLVAFFLLLVISVLISAFKEQATKFFLALGTPMLTTFFPKSASSISSTVASYINSHFIVTPSNLLVGILVFASLCALFLYRPKNVTKKKFLTILIIIILLGTIVRLFLAFNFYGNYDMQSWEIATGILEKGGNVYNETARYNYSPIWFITLDALKSINTTFPMLPFHFIVRSFLALIDLLILIMLLQIMKIEKASYAVQLLVALLYYLNPISFLITGYHGQFETFSILFIVATLYVYTRHLQKGRFYKNTASGVYKALCWIFLSAAMIIKHSFFIETIIGLKKIFKRFSSEFVLFGISSLLFLLSFLPYWSVGKEGIISNVFLYSSLTGVYGITHYVNISILKYFFIAGLFVYPYLIQSEDFAMQLLSGLLFFITFTTGYGDQYFVMPLALAALRYSDWLLWYTYVVSIVILGSSSNFTLFGYNIIMRDVLWIIVLLWFISVNRNPKQQFYKQKI